MSKFFVLYWTRLFIDNGRQTSLHTGGGPTRSEEDICLMVRRGAQSEGPPGLLNKLRCEDNLPDVPEDTLEARGKEFIYYSKSN